MGGSGRRPEPWQGTGLCEDYWLSREGMEGSGGKGEQGGTTDNGPVTVKGRLWE